VRKLLLLLSALLLATAASAQFNAPQLPATGLWNGFNSHLNVVECSNFNTESVMVKLDMASFSNEDLGSTQFLVPGLGSRHTILNSFSIENSHGTYELSLVPNNDDLEQQLYCHTIIYRLSVSGIPKQVEYAFSLPVIGSLTGVSAGLFNSFNPELGSTPVYNWLTVVNDDAASFSASIDLYDQGGSFVETRQVQNLAPGERRDIALGHETGQIVGLFRITPDNLSQRYSAVLIRYLQGTGAFRFAFPVYARTPGCNAEPIAIEALGPITRWIEVGNAGATTKSVTLTIKDPSGNALQTTPITISPRAQEHTYANNALAANERGYFELTCDSPLDELLFQSMTYGHLTAGVLDVEWAYASQSLDTTIDSSKRLALPFNTNLSATNRINLLVPSSSSQANVNLLIFDQAPSEKTFTNFVMAPGGAIPLLLEFLVDSDEVGGALLNTTTSSGTFVADQIRIYPHSNSTFGYVTRIPPLIFDEEVPDVELEEVITGVSSPVFITNAGDSSGRLFVGERAGVIKTYDSSFNLLATFLDISSEVSTSGEQGLFALAFHPNFTSNNKVYVSFTNASGTSIVREYQVTGNVVNTGTARQILSQAQIDAFHNGGALAFGPDGYLYISLGDGTVDGDPQGNAQSLSSLLGKILRVDINSGSPYSIPANNPFIGVAGAREEIFAYGFRNPWRMSFDSSSGKLFVADVGQNTREEINIVTSGNNYGWAILEGTSCFASDSSECSALTTSIKPIDEYSHQEGQAVIGGLIYRGTAISDLQGRYVMADFVTSRIWYLEQSESGVWLRRTLLTPGSFFPSSWGEDESGELYVTALTGKVYRLKAGT